MFMSGSRPLVNFKNSKYENIGEDVHLHKILVGWVLDTKNKSNLNTHWNHNFFNQLQVFLTRT